ncbi:hypothetical protein KJY73_10935 [Bowmanella sp. Y26]|uniref:hypothetical protein n=1 Tax=Bowmanella yangjiangensis TaxID=2811230 RepID=UPI001BDD2DD3|nr:hypothetical protein [Bowmanella yangjiangensis]MBT1064092.1 hypothetical protein [Bowmanella yangjiangensis]
MSTIPPLQKLNDHDRNELKRKCHNQLNWSDGGHWVGVGRKPNCFINEQTSSRLTHTVKFPTDQSANRWNTEWETNIRYAGHIGTAALTTAVGLATGGAAGIAVGTLAAIFKDELQAKIPYPKMYRGWSYQVEFVHQFKWSPHPWGQRELIQTISSKSINHEDKVVAEARSARRYKLDELPEDIARLLATAKFTSSVSEF